MENPNLQKFNLTDFSYEVLFNILLNAEPKDIASYCQTSKRASRICREQSFWREKLWKDYGQQEKIKGLTWQKQYQLGTIRVINSSISAGTVYYAIIDDQGDLYMAGLNSVLGIGENFNKPARIRLDFKVISVTAGQDSGIGDPFIGVVTVDGEVYVWGDNGIGSFPTPQKANLPQQGKIVKFVEEIGDSWYGKRYGIIMDNGSAYLMGGVWEETVLVQQNPKRKIVDLVLPVHGIIYMKAMCFFLDNYGDVFFFYLTKYDERITIKLDFPDPIRQLSSSNDINTALSIKGDVYIWGRGHENGIDVNNTMNYNLRGTEDEPIFKFKVEENWRELIPRSIYKADLPIFIKSISAGYGNLAAVTLNGTAYVWGSNTDYRLVSKIEEEKLLSSGKMIILRKYRIPVIPFPLELKLTSKIKLISLGHRFTIALTEDGILNYWGDTTLVPKDTI